MPNIRGGVQKRLSLGHLAQAIELGLEIGSLSTFFSFENNELGSARIKAEVFEKGVADDWLYQSEIQFSDAHIKVSEEGCANQLEGRRILRVVALDDSRLMDVVLRFVIDKRSVQSAFIGSREIMHKRRNRYHQYFSDKVRIFFKNGEVMTFNPVFSVLPAGFEHVVYLRDEPEKWILHIRALALAPSHYVLKGCSRWYNRPFPFAIQRILLGSQWIRSRLLYVRERISQRIPFQVNGAADLPKGSVIQLGVHWSCRHEAH
ncbi:hypothetical protein [Aquabacterium sp.]|uniref:hypothetical protein n=1 Tax=Aquabacterium sp. TaxID=1872578 RepID=UPI003CFEC51B